MRSENDKTESDRCVGKRIEKKKLRWGIECAKESLQEVGSMSSTEICKKLRSIQDRMQEIRRDERGDQEILVSGREGGK